MELLTVEHKDFTMIVECTKFDGIWNKAKGNVGEDKLYSTYSWSEGVVSVKRTMDADHETDIEQGVSAPATFFDNMDYLNRQAETVYLQATPAVLQQHLKLGKGVRPLLLDKTPEEIDVYIRQQLALREQYYLKAKHILDVNLMDNYDKIAEHIEKIRRILDV